MVAKVKDRQELKQEVWQGGIGYTDPVIDHWGNVVYTTTIIDGYKYKFAPSGSSYCAGPYEKIEDLEKGVVTPSANRHESDSLRMEEGVQKLNPSKTIHPEENKAKNGVIIGHPGRPKKPLPENVIKKSNLSTRELAKKYGVSKSTISNIKNGQRVLV